MYRPKLNSYFSGAGLFDIGFQNSGCEITESFEIDKSACRTLKKNFRHKISECDITKKLVFSDNEADGMIATFPCTKYSSAADIHKKRTGDDLFLHFFRHVALRKPEVFVVENVPGMRRFPVVMEALSRIPDYYTQIYCPVRTDKFLPQMRNRLILIASKKYTLWREPDGFRKISLKEIVEKNPNIEIPDYVFRRMNGAYRDKPIISDPENGDIAPTCVAHYAKDRGTRLVRDRSYNGGLRPYTVREYARLQGVPDWFEFPVSDTEAYRQIGNGVPVVFGEWVGNELVRYFN